ncbi:MULTISPECIES: hypothetical protein [Anaerolinea]|jgi:hypothetical protein|uniref:hypothetical protein n=1 Tax=Anaerolinea TaxID=233189 RepID=UPI00262473E1|nr:hypothetical protein [Anaerolinea thermophila]
MIQSKLQCVFCGVDHETVPLISLRYRDETYFICPQHLPVLIHNPQMLEGKLPGVENLEGHDH